MSVILKPTVGPVIPATELDSQVKRIEEGLSGRTNDLDDLDDPRQSDRVYLASALASHLPLDLLILMLSTNDTKCFYHRPAYEIAVGASVLLRFRNLREAMPPSIPRRNLFGRYHWHWPKCPRRASAKKLLPSDEWPDVVVVVAPADGWHPLIPPPHNAPQHHETSTKVNSRPDRNRAEAVTFREVSAFPLRRAPHAVAT